LKAEVFIRADGGPQIGLGHLVRCSALAHMLKDDFSISFFCKEIPENLQDEFQQNDYFVVIINHEDQFFSQISGDSIVVLDGDGFDTDYQQRIKVSGARLVCIDSLHNREFLADLIISHAPGITSDDYKAQPYTRFALGIKYALLRPSFLEQAEKTRILTKIEKVFICFGGADPLNITEKVLPVSSALRRLLLEQVLNIHPCKN
jgi:UDP-2,4-diacetamido-2,4,6-trideoxy-beta-L-altropyranose hydrolase